MKVWENKVAVVTGANSGIGAATTRQLLELGMTVIGIDKDISYLQELVTKDKDTRRLLHPKLLDLSQPEDILSVFEWIENTFGGVHVFVNNAGVSGQHSLLDGDLEEWRLLINVNVIAVGLCTKLAIKLMNKFGIDGTIINIVSYASQHVPKMESIHFYCATKFAAKALVEGFRQELNDAKSKIRICSINPGLVKTSILLSAVGEKVSNYIYDQHPSLEPEDVAKTIEFIISSPQHVQFQDVNVKPLGSVY